MSEQSNLITLHAEATEELKMISLEKNEASAVINKLKDEIHAMTIQKKELQEQLYEASNELDVITGEKLEYIIEINDFQEKLESSENEKKEMENQYLLMKEEARKIFEEKEKCLDEIKRLKEEFKAIAGESNLHEMKLGRDINAETDLNHRIIVLQERLGNELRGNEVKREHNCQEVDNAKELVNLKNKLEFTVNERKKLEEQLQNTQHQLNKVCREKEQCSVELSEMKIKVEKLTDEKKKFQSKINDSLEELNHIFNEKQKYMDELNESETALQKKTTEYELLQKELKYVKDKLRKYRQENGMKIDDEVAAEDPKKGHDDKLGNGVENFSAKELSDINVEPRCVAIDISELENRLNITKLELESVSKSKMVALTKLDEAKKEIQQMTVEKVQLINQLNLTRCKLEKICSKKDQCVSDIEHVVSNGNGEEEMKNVVNGYALPDLVEINSQATPNGEVQHAAKLMQKMVILNQLDETMNELRKMSGENEESTTEENEIKEELSRIEANKIKLEKLLIVTKTEMEDIFQEKEDTITQLNDVIKELKKMDNEKEDLKGELNETNCKLECILIDREESGSLSQIDNLEGIKNNVDVTNGPFVLKMIGQEIEALTTDREKERIQNGSDKEIMEYAKTEEIKVNEMKRLQDQLKKMSIEKEAREKEMDKLKQELEDVLSNRELDQVKYKLEVCYHEKESFVTELNDIKMELQRALNEKNRSIVEDDGSITDDYTSDVILEGGQSNAEKTGRKSEFANVKIALQRVIREQDAFAAQLLTTKNELENRFDKFKQDSLEKNENFRRIVEGALEDLRALEAKLPKPKMFKRKKSNLRKEIVTRLQLQLKSGLEKFMQY